MCIYKLYGRLIGHEELFVSGVFFHGNDKFNAKGAVQEVNYVYAWGVFGGNYSKASCRRV